MTVDLRVNFANHPNQARRIEEKEKEIGETIRGPGERIIPTSGPV